ncbi:MAG: DEAD/DEAH box helicase family protein [Myxococcaceae bacterium]|nr:DEAD/DEAH box helicase family protein [Myxococcaceae bacterium]
MPKGSSHPLQRRLHAEELVRLRRSDEHRRAIAPQRAARIDPNPHQIDAVVFALARVREGGCILADEVGLGKTIEAGLVITQLLAEGARRVLLIAPKSLVGQWRDELMTLFDLEAREGQPKPGGFDGPGVFLVNREAAGSEKGRDALLSSEPFDLCVIDEAHEVFAGIYKRFRPSGDYDDEAPAARTAGRVREVLQASQTPVLLLTATPIQNNLAELWGLVQYVDPLGTLLGDLPTFRQVFCGDDDRQLARGQEQELRSRLEHVLQRTLRRQAQAFLEKPFVGRQARLFEYSMSVSERALYDDVTKYLLEPGIRAFQGRHRKLLLLGFHRRMASSTRALASSLEHVAARLRKIARGEAPDDRALDAMVADLDDDELVVPADDDAPASAEPVNVSMELARVETFIQRANALVRDDGRFRALLTAIDFVATRAKAGQGSDKLVIFTESLVTQEYLRDALVESGLVRPGEITLFRGTNDGPRAHQALERWRAEVPADAQPPSKDIALRLALVHEFKTRTRVFISTEAGAKGLNLQFCNAVVNWDLPWNPQRIEQRIGRCHRYGQQHDVTVINFIAKDNEAQALTFEILAQKLELFGTVLSASDQVLHRPQGADGEVLASALGAEVEAELARIYERARTIEEVHAELRALREKVAEDRRRYEETRARTIGIIEQRFDDEVQRVFRLHRDAVSSSLAALDHELGQVVREWLAAHGIGFEEQTRDGATLLVIAASPLLPALREGVTVALGVAAEHQSLHLGHPLVRAAVEDARRFSGGGAISLARRPEWGIPAGTGRLRLVRAVFDGFERVELIVPIVVSPDAQVLDQPAARGLLDEAMADVKAARAIDDAIMADAQEQTLFLLQTDVDDAEHRRFEAASLQAQRFLDDRLLVLRRQRAEVEQKIDSATKRRDGAIGSEARTAAEHGLQVAGRELQALEEKIAKLQARDDERYRRFLEHIHGRRYTPPRLDLLVDLDVVFT